PPTPHGILHLLCRGESNRRTSMTAGSAFVTGGTGGLGRAVTGRFLRDGYRVAVTYRAEKEWEELKREHESSARTGSLLGLQSDVTQEESVRESVHALVQTLAKELKKEGVTANAILPSVIDTPPNRAAMPDADFSAWVPPDAVAALLAYLASHEAAWTSGALVPIYGRA